MEALEQLEKLFRDEADFRLAKSILKFCYQLEGIVAFGIERNSLLREIKYGKANHYMAAIHRKKIEGNPDYINKVISSLIKENYLFEVRYYKTIKLDNLRLNRNKMNEIIEIFESENSMLKI